MLLKVVTFPVEIQFVKDMLNVYESWLPVQVEPQPILHFSVKVEYHRRCNI